MRVRRSVGWRRLLLGLTVLALAAAPATAQEGLGWWGSHYTPGNVMFGAGVGLRPNPLAIEFYPGAETIFYKWRPANLFAIDFGVGARGVVGFSTGTTGGLVLGGGPYLAWHWGFRGLGGLSPFLEYLEPLDVFSAFGLSFLTFPGSGVGGGLVFTNYSGLNYFLSDNFAVSLSSTFFGGYGGRTTLGVTYKIGPKERLGDAPVVYQHILFDYVFMMSYAWFYYDDNFSVGDEVTFEYTQTADGETWMSEFEVTRALLHRGADGTSWWRAEFNHPDMEGNPIYPTQYEFRVNEQWDVLEFRYRHPQTGRLRSEVPDDIAKWRMMVDEQREFADPEEMARYRVGSERLTVPAGTFSTEVYRSRPDDEADWTVWLSNDVPGLIVKFSGTAMVAESDEIETAGAEGILQRVRRDVTSPWTPAW